MKYTITTIAILALGFTACKNAPSTTQVTHTEEHAAAVAPVAANAIIDPVCGMAKDDTWTDYTMYKGDTVWFCATSEKDAFVANPTKYEKNLQHH
ncbi:MAG: hypothetical protein ABI378_07190 [Chitinophagaceae bacterium]